MGQSKKPRKVLGEFEMDERRWFLTYDPEDFEDDGRHVLNGMPRKLAPAPQVEVFEEAMPKSSQQLPWASVACFGLVGLSVFALIASLSV